MKIQRQLFFLALMLLLFSNCNAQEQRTYWAANEVYRISRETIHGVTLAYMESLAEEQLHVVKSGDSLEFHYPFEKKVKASELRTVSNFKLFDDYNEALDSVYYAGLENGGFVIKFCYLGGLNKDNKFIITFDQLSREEYFEEIKKIKKENGEKH